MSDSNTQFGFAKDSKGIVIVTMDMDGPVNAMNDRYSALMGNTVDALESMPDLKGVIITSAKSTFFAGGDLNQILATTAEESLAFRAFLENIKSQLRRLEKLPVPVVAAINGAAMGGGCELALACNYRVMLNKPGSSIGMPEVTLGLLPGAGGIVRTINMLGLEQGLPLLVKGSRLKPSKALEIGIVDELVNTAEDLIPAAREWIVNSGAEASVQPWDSKGHKIPGGNVSSTQIAMGVSAMGTMLAKETRGLLPAPTKILDVAAQASLLDFDAALVVETRGIVELAVTPQAKNIISSMFFQMNEINGGKSRPSHIESCEIKKVAVLGAGMMGQGIAYDSAKAGLEVYLVDVSLQAAQKGKEYSAMLMDKAIRRGRASEEAKKALLDRITPIDDYSALQDIDIVVEAVFENAELKAKVTELAESGLAPDGVFATNTSTLPITMLAEASKDSEKFIGIHFFSPVDKMPLVEIITGEKTSDFALAKAFDYSRKIGKTPIVVKDSVGFYTSRTIGGFFDEGCRLLEEGVDPVLIENLARQVGMPVGPLAILDEISLETMRKINATQRELNLFETTYAAEVSDRIGIQMIDDHGRGGRNYNGGFYEYHEDGSKNIWPGLYELYYKSETDLPFQDIKDRILFRQAVAAVECLEEGVLKSVADGNIGALLGIGAPAWTGGWIQFVNSYGLVKFQQRCNELAEKYGELFTAPAILEEKISKNEIFI